MTALIPPESPAVINISNLTLILHDLSGWQTANFSLEYFRHEDNNERWWEMTRDDARLPPGIQCGQGWVGLVGAGWDQLSTQRLREEGEVRVVEWGQLSTARHSSNCEPLQTQLALSVMWGPPVFPGSAGTTSHWDGQRWASPLLTVNNPLQYARISEMKYLFSIGFPQHLSWVMSWKIIECAVTLIVGIGNIHPCRELHTSLCFRSSQLI